MQQGIEKQLLPRPAYELAELVYNIPEFAALAWAAARYRPDALYERLNLFMLSGTWLSKLFNLPLLLEVNSPLAEERAKFGGLSWGRLAAWSEEHAWRSAHRVLPVTGVLANRIEQAGVSPSRISVIANGVDVDRFKNLHRESCKRQLGISGSLVLGFVGYMRPWHGLNEVIELLAVAPSLEKATFLIVGDGPAREALEARARELGVADRLVMAGVVTREVLPQYIGAMDIALQPDVTPYASPLKLFEYMAAGRAIVAPSSPNILEVLEHGKDALLFAPGNTTELTECICRLAQNESLRESVGQAAAAKIERDDRTWRNNARRVAAIVSQVRNARRPAPTRPGRPELAPP
jgi:glycosyltransferase involved in cell wall biosynthesis